MSGLSHPNPEFQVDETKPAGYGVRREEGSFSLLSEDCVSGAHNSWRSRKPKPSFPYVKFAWFLLTFSKDHGRCHWSELLFVAL